MAHRTTWLRSDFSGIQVTAVSSLQPGMTALAGNGIGPFNGFAVVAGKVGAPCRYVVVGNLHRSSGYIVGAGVVLVERLVTRPVAGRSGSIGCEAGRPSRRPSGLRKTTITLNSLAHRATWLRSDLHPVDTL